MQKSGWRPRGGGVRAVMGRKSWRFEGGRRKGASGFGAGWESRSDNRQSLKVRGRAREESGEDHKL